MQPWYRRAAATRGALLSCCILYFFSCIGQVIDFAGKPGKLVISAAGKGAVRVTLSPLTFKPTYPFSPSIAKKDLIADLMLQKIKGTVSRKINGLQIDISNNPLTIVLRNERGQLIQH